MDALIRKLFRVGGDWAELNLDEESKDIAIREPNPCLDAMYCWGWVDHLTRAKSVAYTYGGYMEDRGRVWRGHYMEPGHTVHLGVDYNVLNRTPVHCPANAEVVHVTRDPDQYGGWGGRVILMRKGRFLVLAHLAHYLLPQLGPVKEGDILGQVGEIEENGGWYPHLHVQCCSVFNPQTTDGYAKASDDLKVLYPHPEVWLAG